MSDYLVKNPLGGINDMDKSALNRAKRADLVTLPLNIKGTNCGNCKWIRENRCTHPQVVQAVNNRMCCALWERIDMYTPFKRGTAIK